MYGGVVKCICGVEFLKKHSTHLFCSTLCKNKAKGNKAVKTPLKEKKCKYCKTTFKPKNSLQVFCRELCDKKYTKEREERLGLVKKATKTQEQNKVFEKNKKILKERIVDEVGYLLCEKCTRTDLPFEVHHIVFRSEAPLHKHLHSLPNLIHLCIDCHDWYHEDKSRREELVKERKLVKIFGQSIIIIK